MAHFKHTFIFQEVKYPFKRHVAYSIHLTLGLLVEEVLHEISGLE